MERNLKELIGQMTLEEKAGLCSGGDFWRTKAVERLGIPQIMMSDGPHGLRKQDEGGDHLGINDSIRAVCFPAACLTACSFDPDLLEEMGETIGEECQAENLALVLGPAVNIKRSPLCGRNFEYFSEDPYLAGKMAAAFIRGAQSKGVGTSIKHFAANNQEFRRMTGSSEVDEQTLHEIYLTAFEIAVKEAAPKTVMCSYNKVNGTLASENRYLLTEVLREKWGFEGFVVSDWGAVDRRVEGLEAGLDLEMPSSNGTNDAEIVQAVRSGRLSEEILDQAVERILKVTFDYTANHYETLWDRASDHVKARQIAEKSAVLLKNEGVLPLESAGKVAFIGAFAESPRYQGGGSSHVNAFHVSSALEAAGDTVSYAPGFRVGDEDLDEALLAEALETARAADTAVIFAGLPESYESEGYDREHMRMPAAQNALIEAVAQVQPRTVVVLHNGAPVEMPWADSVLGILEMYLSGEASGEAVVNLLYGKVNPSGRLAETIPYRLQDTPAYLNFPGDGRKVHYREGLFVGYRYYDKKEMPVRYPFGYGLSYTTFAYQDLKTDRTELDDTETVTVSLTVENTGGRAGAEVVQIYVAGGDPGRPVKELKAFTKVELAPGERKEVRLTLGSRSFAQYSTDLHDWYVKTGTYRILAARSAQEVVLETTVHVRGTTEIPLIVERNTTLGEMLDHESTRKAAQDLVNFMDNFFGKDDEGAAEKKEEKDEAVGDAMGDSIARNMPVRGVTPFMGLTSAEVDALIEKINREAQS